MAEASSRRTSTRVTRTVRASREAVYRAFLDRDAVASWLPPESMTGRVHTFEPREGGRIRMSLTYTDPTHARGKTSEDTDTFEGRIVELAPGERIVWAVTFDSSDPAFAGEMRVSFTLADADGGVEVVVQCDDIPVGIRPDDNEAGCRSTLQKLAAIVEGGAAGAACG